MFSRATHQVAVAAALLTFCLLALGGVVTSRDAGMIFPDWPLSDGSVNPDGWLTNADKFSEHGHRILGALTGIATIATAWLIQRSNARRWLKITGWSAVLAVTGQGLLGGIRVTEVSTFLALFHGCTGQMYFCLMVALVYFTGRDFGQKRTDDRDTTTVAIVAAGVWIATLMQVVLGARIRHIHGPVNDHLLGALVVTGSTLWLVTLIVLRHGPALRTPAFLLLGLLVGQIALGLGTADVLSPDNRTWDVTFAQLSLPSLHQAIGAVLMAVETVIILRAWHRREPTASLRGVPA
jgi:cytochrome c oxidase assembly protein subunit 15